MAERISSILDASGTPFRHANGKPRPELADALIAQSRSRKPINAKYDAAQDTNEFKNYWAATDAYDADSSNSRAVREKLVPRSRYEVGSNGYADGIASTYATDLIGRGPTLRMQTGSEGFNQMVELAWYEWTKAIKFRRKLWTLAHAKHVDGEGIGVIRRNSKVRHPIPLDVVLYETEQCQTPLLPFLEEGYIDGIKFDEFGNPIWYDIIRQHPGATGYMRFDLKPEQVPARYVLHWFKMRRPGQHRGIPESTSTLNTGAAARRWREATLAAAETAADFTTLLKTQFQPEQVDAVAPMSAVDIQKRMMVALPTGWDAHQMKAEHPTATYESFHKSLVNEQARPKSMPYNKAACDSSSYNYASGRLDHQTYYAALDVERDDCDDLVLDPLFDVWFDMAVMRYGWLGGNPDRVSTGARSHIWDWPKHRVADIKTEADAIDTQLKNGTLSIAAAYTAMGQDYEDAVIQQASANGVSVEQQKQINLICNLPQHAAQIVAQLLGLQSQPATATTGAQPNGT